MQPADRYIRRPELLVITGYSYPTIWRMEKAGEFPRRVSLGRRAVAWKLSEVTAWVESRQRVA